MTGGLLCPRLSHSQALTNPHFREQVSPGPLPLLLVLKHQLGLPVIPCSVGLTVTVSGCEQLPMTVCSTYP